jgi:hypothetical protein
MMGKGLSTSVHASSTLLALACARLIAKLSLVPAALTVASLLAARLKGTRKACKHAQQ